MSEEEGDKKKSVEDIFKNAFTPSAKAEEQKEEKPASEMFKDIFTPKKMGVGVSEEEKKEVDEWLTEREPPKEPPKQEPAPPQPRPQAKPKAEEPKSMLFKDIFTPQGGAPTPPTPPTPEKPPEQAPAPEVVEQKPEPSLREVVKEAQEKGSIDKQTVEKIIKSNVEGKGLLGEFIVLEKNGKPEIILDEGEIEIPKSAKVEVLKRDGEIAIIVKKGEGEGNVEELEKLIGSGEGKGEVDMIKGFEEMDEMDWSDVGGEETGLGGETNNEFDLINLRNEFRPEKKEEEEEEEEGEEEEEPSIIDRILKRVKKTTEESKKDKLRRMSLENLSRVREISDERRAIVGVAYVLKQFLEIKYNIPHELTYMELINEIRMCEMKNDLRGKLITFFKKTAVMVYANQPKIDSFSRVYSLAERTIKELS